MQTNLSRRVAITGLCAAVAVPVSVKASPATFAGYDPAAALGRAESIIDALMTRVVCAGWARPDREDRERFLRYFRQQVANPTYDDADDWGAVIGFCERYGQSLDWLMRGEPCSMICSGAARSEWAAMRQACR